MEKIVYPPNNLARKGMAYLKVHDLKTWREERIWELESKRDSGCGTSRDKKELAKLLKEKGG